MSYCIGYNETSIGHYISRWINLNVFIVSAQISPVMTVEPQRLKQLSTGAKFPA